MQEYRDDVLMVGNGAGLIAIESLVGIYRAFEEKGIVPGKVYSSSGATLFSSLYYSGKDLDWFNNLMKQPESNFFSLSPISAIGIGFGYANHIFENRNVYKILEKNMTADATFRVTTSVTRVDDTGYHAEMRPVMPGYTLAATSIPFIFRPVVINGKTFVDGGVLNNLPAPTIEEAKTWKHIFVFVAPPSVYKQDTVINALLGLLNAVMERENVELEQSGFYELPNVHKIQLDSALSGGLLKWSNNMELRDAYYEHAKEVIENALV